MLRDVAFAALFGLACAISLHAQSTNASLTGRVTDPPRAVIAEAKVIVINTGTGVRYEGITNQTGTYYVTDLPPGGLAHRSRKNRLQGRNQD